MRSLRGKHSTCERLLLVVPSGTVFRLTGRILHISFLDHKGAIIPTPSERWDMRSELDPFDLSPSCVFCSCRSEAKNNRATDGLQDLNSSSPALAAGNSVTSPTTAIPSNTTQFAVFCSSKEARVRRAPISSAFLTVRARIGHRPALASVDIQAEDLRLHGYIRIEHHARVGGQNCR